MTEPTKAKARKILNDGRANGKKLSPKQRRFMGHVLNKAKDGKLVTKATNGDEVAEGEPTQRRQESARELITQGLRGMADGGIVGPTFEGQAGPGDGLLALLQAAEALMAANQGTGLTLDDIGGAFINANQQFSAGGGTSDQGLQYFVRLAMNDALKQAMARSMTPPTPRTPVPSQTSTPVPTGTPTPPSRPAVGY